MDYTAGSDEFGSIRFTTPPSKEYKIGDKLEVIVPHCDPAVNEYDQMYGIRKDSVEVVWPITAEGSRSRAVSSQLSAFRGPAWRVGSVLAVRVEATVVPSSDSPNALSLRRRTQDRFQVSRSSAIYPAIRHGKSVPPLPPGHTGPRG